MNTTESSFTTTIASPGTRYPVPLDDPPRVSLPPHNREPRPPPVLHRLRHVRVEVAEGRLPGGEGRRGREPGGDGEGEPGADRTRRGPAERWTGHVEAARRRGMGRCVPDKLTATASR